MYYSLYDYGFSFGDSRDSFDWKSSIETFNFKPEYAWSINPTNELTFGGEAILYGFKPAVAEVINGGVTTEIDLGEKRALESSVYASNSQDFGSKLSVEYGMRWSHFMRLGGFRYHYGDTLAGLEKPLIAIQKVVDGKASDYTYNLEPRFSAKYQLSTNSSVKASYNRTIQYLHQISNTNVSTPTDIWYPSNNNVLPQKGQQVALGYFKNIDGI